MINLANILCDELGEPEDAVRWYRRAIDLGSTAAAKNLGMLDEGRTEDAREMFELARTRGGTTSYLGLAAVEYEDDQPQRARAARRAAHRSGRARGGRGAAAPWPVARGAGHGRGPARPARP